MNIVSKRLMPLICAIFTFCTGSVFADIPAVQHIVIIFQENRTPDNLFHGLPSMLPAADIANSGINSHGQVITLTPTPLAGTFDMAHTHLAFTQMYDNGKMDGGDLPICTPIPGTVCPSNPAFEYTNPSDVAPYFFIALNYGFANRMFQSNQGPSLPAHQFILSGTSQPTATSLFFASDNPKNNTTKTYGCNAPLGTIVALVGPSGMTASSYPCFEHATLTDMIDNPPVGARPGLTWRYYAYSAGAYLNAANAIRHICQPAGTPLSCTGPDWTNGKIALNSAQVLTDVQNNNLASLSWVIPTPKESDHAIANDGSGPSWVASVVNAIGNSPYWQNTVILITWDDWGGWYDHVAPPLNSGVSYYENGFRVPLLVVSPYTPAGYVSRKIHTTGSILRFIETAFSLPLIPPGNFADSTSDNLADFFNFNAPPRSFVTIPAPLSADFFLHDKRPKTGDEDY